MVFALITGVLTALAQETEEPHPVSGMGEASNERSIHLLPDPLAGAAAWMLNQPETQLRAAALLSPAAGGTEERRRRILDEVRSTTDGAAMLWLAHACRANGLSEECTKEGLDDAIVKDDGGNLYARMALHDDRDLPRLILDSRRESMYGPELIESWYRGLSSVGERHRLDTAGRRLTDAMEIASLWNRDAIGYALLEPCRSVPMESALLRACEALADRLIRSATNTLESSIATLALRPSRATEAERASHSRIANHTDCLRMALQPEVNAMDNLAVRRFLDEFKRVDEFEAWAQLAATYAIDCREPVSRLTVELQKKAEFDAKALDLATAMMDDDRERVRAAGLVHLLIQQTDVSTHPDDQFDALEDLIATSTDGAVLAWLARACAALAHQARCIEAGLETAIIELDQGNLYSRVLLHGPERIPDLLGEDSIHVRSYFDELAALWYPELETNRSSGDSVMAHVRLAQAWTLAGLADSPDLLPFFTACGENGDAETTDCSRLAEQLIRKGRTGSERLGGIEVMRRLAERSGDHAERGDLRALYQRANRAHGCISLERWRARKLMGVADVHDELTQRVESGEWTVIRNAYSAIDSGCPELPTDAELTRIVEPFSP